MKCANAILGKLDAALPMLQDLAARDGMNVIPDAIVSPLKEAIKQLTAWRVQAHAVVSSVGDADVQLPSPQEVSSVITTGKRAMQLICNMLAAVSRASLG